MYANCPKCGHAPLPADQAAPAACPACGIILAKFAARAASGAAVLPPSVSRASAADEDEEVDESTFLGYVRSLLTEVPREVSPLNWYGRCAALAVAMLWTFWIFKDTDVPAGEIGSRVLHIILTPFHEAGHTIFRLFGIQFLTILGGTLGQHLFAIILGGALLIQRRDAFGASLFAWVLGFSVIDMGIYMYDAYDPHLMLLDGHTGQDSDGHDWQNMFGDMGLIRKARGIGVFFGGVGRCMMIAALAWSAWLLWKQRARLSDNPMAEEGF